MSLTVLAADNSDISSPSVAPETATDVAAAPSDSQPAAESTDPAAIQTEPVASDPAVSNPSGSETVPQEGNAVVAQETPAVSEQTNALPSAVAEAPATPATNRVVDLDAIPVTEVASLTLQDLNTNEMVHIRGVVVDLRVGESIQVRDSTGTIYARSSMTLAVRPGEVVDLWGIPRADLEAERVTLRQASFRTQAAAQRAQSSAPQERPAELPLLTNARDVRELSVEKAAWKYPVHLRGVVTFYSQTRAQLFIHDETSGINITVSTNSLDLKTGDLVEVKGVSDPGGFAPAVVPSSITVVGTGSLPEPRKASLYRLATGEFDAQWIEAQGVVRSTNYFRNTLRLRLSDSDGTLTVNIPIENVPTNVIDAVVRVRGVCGPRFNDRRQLTGVSIWSPSLEHVEIVEAGAADPFNLPIQPIVSLTQFRPSESYQRRVKVAGVVTLRQTNSFFLQDANDGLQVMTSRAMEVEPGDKVLAVGYVVPSGFGSVLQDAFVKVVEKGAAPEPKQVSVQSIFDPQLNNQWVRMNARLLNHVKVDRAEILTLQFPGAVFEAHCLSASDREWPAAGTLLQLSGVYQIVANEDRTPIGFKLILPSAEQIAVLEHPSWWTLRRTMTVVGSMALLVAATILWVMLLRRKVQEQTKALRERLEHEAALEQRYREIFEGATDLIFTYNLDGQLTSLNSAGQRVLGYSSEEISSLSIGQILTPESSAMEQQLRESRLADGNVVTCEFELVAKDGRHVVVEASTRLLVKNNCATGVQAIARDISERKQAQLALEQSENKFRSLIEESLVGVYIVQDGCFAYVNPRMAEIFGYSPEEMISLPLQSVVLAEDYAVVLEQVQRRLQGEVKTVHFTFRGQRKDGSVLYAEVLGSGTEYNGAPALIGTLADITERKRAEEELFNSRQMLRTVLDTIPQRVFWKDRNSAFVGCNKSFAEDCGYSDPNELVGKTDFETKSAELAELYQADDRNVMDSGVAKLGYEEPQIRPDGSQGWLKTNKVPLFDKDGYVVGVLGTYEDISDRKRADALLAEASSLLDAMLENSPDYIYFKDRDSRFVRYSKSMADLFHLSDPNDLKGKSDFDFFTDDHARGAYEDEQRIIRTGEPLIGKPEKEIHSDGRTTWALTTKLPWRDKNGNIIGTFGISKDVTAIKEAEEQIAREQELLRAMMDNFPDVIYFKDLESRFVRVSRSKAERSLKIVKAQYLMEHPDTPEDQLPSHLTSVENFNDWLMGKSDFDTFARERAQTAYDDEQNIIRTAEPLIAKIERTPQADGRITWCISTKMPWRDKNGNIIGTFGVSKDITALKEAEQKLAQERELFHALVDNLPDAIYFKDLKSRYVRLSRSKVERSRQVLIDRFRSENPDGELPPHLADTEKCAEYLIGQSDFDLYPQERARSAYNDEQQIIKSGKPIIGKPEHVKQPDGKVSWVLSTKMPWFDAQGNIIGTFGVSRDISDLKEAEAQLEAAHKRLVDTSRLAGMAEVATDVLHNVGNVLNSVNVSCSLTMDKVKSSKVSSLTKVAALLQENRTRLSEFFVTDARGQQLPNYLTTLSEHLGAEQSALLKELEQLLKHIDHIKQIVTMQQSYAKVAGVLESISPAQLVEDALHINAAALVRHDVHVQREFDDAPPILTEKHKVLQILVNLIRNAKYALDEAKRSDKTLRLKVGGDGNGGVKIEVIDNGVGIPKENLTRIFSHGFTTRKDGHGFGLHSSALAVRDLGGAIHAHSEGSGQGAIFTLTLPLHPPQRSPEKEKPTKV